MKYHISKTLSETNFSKAVENVTESLKTEGFGVLTEIDIQATMKNKLGKEYPKFLILGACNPVYADKVLSIDPQVSTMLPCNVVVRETEAGDIEVSAIDPLAAMGSINNPQIETFAGEVYEKLKRVIDSI